MEADLEQLLNNNRLIWRGRGRCASSGRGLPTGYAALDAVLPESGWQAGSLVEVMAPRWGIGELQLFLPAMVAASQAGKQLVWIAPPYIPYAPALAGSGISLDRLLVLHPPHQKDIPWAMEMVLRQRRCAIVLTWPGHLAPKMVRRLQLAAEEGDNLGVLLHSKSRHSAFAATRLLLTPNAAGLQVTILKSRAAHCRQTVTIAFD